MFIKVELERGKNNMLPTVQHTEEEFALNPEVLEIAETYLKTMSTEETSAVLEVPKEEIVRTLAKPEVKRFVDHIFMELGYNNRLKIQDTMDKIIESKLEEAEETEVYSSKDLADLLQMKHKMRMDELKAQIELEKAKGPGKQVNIQQNNYGDNLTGLIERLSK